MRYASNKFVHIPNFDSWICRYLYNEIDSLSPIFLPPTLSKLDLSHNRLERFFIIWRKNEAPSLSELNLSDNKHECVVISRIPMRKIDASNNDLKGVGLYSKDIEYVDISNNPQLSNRVGFDPSKVDTVIVKRSVRLHQLISE